SDCREVTLAKTSKRGGRRGGNVGRSPPKPQAALTPKGANTEEEAMKQPFRILILAFALGFIRPLPKALSRDDADVPVVRLSATLTRTAEKTGQLLVTADVKKGFHIYAPSQPRPFLATKITVAESAAARVTGAFAASRPPKILKHPTIKVELHQYEGQVTWTAPVEFR